MFEPFIRIRLSILLSERPRRKSYSASSFVNLVYGPVLLRKITLPGCFNAAYLAIGTLLLFQADVRYPCSGVVLILPIRDHHLHTHCNKTCTRPWHKVIECKTKNTSFSDFVRSRIIAGLSRDIVIRKDVSQKISTT